MKSKSRKILIIEDERPLARALELKLRRLGFDITTVLDGEEALVAICKNNFDLILLDIILPNVDGFRILEELKKRKNKCPVFVVSNLCQEEDILRARNLGAKEYFVKADAPLVEIILCVKKFFKFSPP